mmetsp:Transcript_10920/g.37882  ORF Transcript_10920/g.37882 Transcript_10920/m.37882 type:complete len:235 (-) Transcript_10920:1317-2021(-)
MVVARPRGLETVGPDALQVGGLAAGAARGNEEVSCIVECQGKKFVVGVRRRRAGLRRRGGGFRDFAAVPRTLRFVCHGPLQPEHSLRRWEVGLRALLRAVYVEPRLAENGLKVGNVPSFHFVVAQRSGNESIFASLLEVPSPIVRRRRDEDRHGGPRSEEREQAVVFDSADVVARIIDEADADCKPRVLQSQKPAFRHPNRRLGPLQPDPHLVEAAAAVGLRPRLAGVARDEDV